MAEKTNLQREDFSKWYIQTIQKADLMDYSPVRGCMIFKPDGYEIWEHIQEEFNRRFKEEGIRNAYFPMLIPESFFTKEADHIEGFAPELPWVTEAAGEKLLEQLFQTGSIHTVIFHMKSTNGQTYSVGKRKLYHSYVLQSSYGKKDIQRMQMKKMHVAVQ